MAFIWPLLGKAARLVWDPQDEARKIAEQALQAMAQRKPEIAIQECVVRRVEPETEGVVFADAWQTWPSSKARGYIAILDAVNANINATPADKALLGKFLTEQIGIEGCKWTIRQEARENLQEDAFKVFHGPYVVNMRARDSTDKLWVGEAKGGAAKLQPGQGTRANVLKTAKKMKNNQRKSKKRLRGETDAEQEARVAEESKRRKDVGEEIEDEILTNPFNSRFLSTSVAVDGRSNPIIIKDVKI